MYTALDSTADSNLYSTWWSCIICIALGGAALYSLELFIHACYMWCCYCASGVIVACGTAQLSIWWPLHEGLIIDDFHLCGIFYLRRLGVAIDIKWNSWYFYPASLQNYRAESELCCRRRIISATLMPLSLLNFYSTWQHCGKMLNKFL